MKGGRKFEAPPRSIGRWLVAAKDAGDVAENGDGLVQRHKVTALATCRLFVGAAGVFTKRDNLVVEFGYSSFEFQNFRNAGEIHAVFHQLVDARQALEVGIGIATIAARRAGRFKQTLALIDTQSLGMHAGKFSRN